MKLVKEFALLLGSLACAGSALADGAATEDEGITSVGVTAITSANKNTIVAVSYGELGTGNPVSVANLVKTTNLAEGDQLVVYKGDGTHETWVLAKDSSNALVWSPNANTFTQDANGDTSSGTGSDTDMTLGVGTGFWLVRNNWKDDDSVTFYIYGSVASNPTSTTTPGTWTLVGNPTRTSKTITAAMTPGASKNDVIAVAEKNGFVNYFFKGTGELAAWKREPSAESPTWGVAPVIEAGKGFWIKSTATSVDWTK